MESQASIYDLLAKKTLTNIKTTDIHSAQSRTYADTASFDFWQGVMMLSKAVEVSRTFSSGNLPIYNTGAVVSAALADGANVTHTPAGTEIWQLQLISYDSCTFALKDADGNVIPLSQRFDPESPRITRTKVRAYEPAGKELPDTIYIESAAIKAGRSKLNGAQLTQYDQAREDLNEFLAKEQAEAESGGEMYEKFTYDLVAM